MRPLHAVYLYRMRLPRVRACVRIFHTLMNLRMHVEKTCVYMATSPRVSRSVPFIISAH